MIFQTQQTFNIQATLLPLSHALDNWINIWQVYSGGLQHLSVHDPLAGEAITPSNMWKRIGFSRFADEYWLLAKLITEKMKMSAQRSDPHSRPAALGAAASNMPSDDEAILTKYDETSMRQVNSLIADFQRILL